MIEALRDLRENKEQEEAGESEGLRIHECPPKSTFLQSAGKMTRQILGIKELKYDKK